jgi:hypothetical protein
LKDKGPTRRASGNDSQGQLLVATLRACRYDV